MAKTKKEDGRYDPDLVADFKAMLTGDEEPTELAGQAVEVKGERVVGSHSVPVEIGAPVAAGRKHQPPAEVVRPPSAAEKKVPPPEMQKLQRRTTRPKPWGWILGGLGLIAAASLAGWFFFNRAERFSGTKVSLAVKPTAEVASGSAISIAIEYSNQEPVDLVQSEIAVEYPSGFTFSQADQPSLNEFNNAFSIGTIKTGHRGTLTISGTIIGAVDTTAEFSATLTYRSANFNSDFQTKAAGRTKITSSILGLKLTGPNKLTPGASATWTITYTNTSDQDLDKVQIEAIYPNQLTISKTKPTADERNAVWRVDRVAKGDKGQIEVTGTVNGTLGDSLTLLVRVGLVRATNTVDLQDEQSLLVILVNTGLTTTVAVNGATDQGTADAGDTLNYTIRVANKGDVEVNDITVTVSLTGQPLKFETLQNPMLAEVSTENQTLTWTKLELAALSLLKPGQEAALNFSIATAPGLVIAKDSDKDPNVTATVTTTSPALAVNTNTASGATVFITKFRTVFGLATEARYYADDGTAYGAGPLPPKVGQPTTYRIIWNITNTTSEATDMVVSATLPNSVFWTGQNVGRDAGDIIFEPTTREVRWTLNKVPAGTGSRLPKLTANFDVSITPTADQVGTVVVLSEISSASAVDAYSGASINVTAPSLTTDLLTDPQAAGKGKVGA